jgi:hypothetical protein
MTTGADVRTRRLPTRCGAGAAASTKEGTMQGPQRGIAASVSIVFASVADALPDANGDTTRCAG